MESSFRTAVIAINLFCGLADVYNTVPIVADTNHRAVNACVTAANFLVAGEVTARNKISPHKSF